jgi:hypothetical protein
MDSKKPIKKEAVTDSELEQLWKESGFTSKEKLYKFIKSRPEYKAKKITQKAVDDFLAKKETQQIKQVAKKETLSRTILSKGPRQDYQIDIMVYTRNPRRGYKYILGCIDVYSRYAMCVALKTREADEYIPALMKIFKAMGIPKNINCDNEFATRFIKSYCEENNITLWLSYADEAVIDSKNSIIERFWKTLAQKIADYRNNTGNGDWPAMLDEIVTSYNMTYHETIRGEPTSVFQGKELNKQDIVILPMKFSRGEKVRIRTKKKNFAKGDEETFSREVYELVEKDKEQKNRWFVKNIGTGETLSRSYMERDFSPITAEVLKPNIEVIRMVEKEKEVQRGEKGKERVKRELKELKIDATDKLGKGAEGKRERKTPKKLNL